MPRHPESSSGPTDSDPQATKRIVVTDIVAELASEGFDDAREIGRGGFGVVYRCLQTALDRTVAIKVLSSDLDGEDRERFLREQRAMGKLSGHPHVVDILQSGVTRSGRPYIVMPYHSRNSLDAWIRREGPLPWSETLRVGVKLAGALETAHRLGTLHRDVKPANILLTGYGEPQLTDFGIARVTGGFETTSSMITGSPAFTAPEVLRGDAPSASSDVYSLGAALFCLLTGHAAFERRSGERLVAQFLRIATQPVPDLRGEDIPDDVCAAIERAMSEEPTDRPASAAEFGQELRDIERRHGLDVDEMALPAAADEFPRTEHTAAPTTQSSTSGHSRSYRRRSGATPPSAAARFRPPTPMRSLVERTRLLELLRLGQRRRLTLIHAPAGFGKSTVAAQWRDVLIEDGSAVAWLTVDNDDNNVVWFLSHLVEAIRRAEPSLADELGQALDENGAEAERYVLTSLVNQVHDSRRHVVVMIDDWHRVTSPDTIAAMDFILENGCHHLQMVVSSRSQAGLPLAKMRVRDELVEIDSVALRFDITESQRFLVDLGGLHLEDSDVEALEETTDGWVAALQLASLSLRDRTDPGDLIRHMSGRHHAIGEYLAENVLSTLEPALLDFMLATSVTERVCGDLACVLANVTRGQALLEQVESRDLFLRSLDEDREWFEYHHLFAEYLRRRLERDHPSRIADLHRAAAHWFADHHYVSDAVDHALAAGDRDVAVAVVEEQGMYLVEHSRMVALLGLVDKLPRRLVESSPRIQIAVAWANILLQRVAPTLRSLSLVASALESSTLSDTEQADIRVEADIVRAVIAVSSDRIAGVPDLIAECLARPETLRAWVVSAGSNLASAAAIAQFDFVEARRLQDWATGYHQRTVGPFSRMYGYSFAGIAAMEQLDIAAAEDNFRLAVQTATKLAGTHSHAARLAGALLGELMYELGHLDEAERLLDESYELGPEGGIVDFMIARFVTGARLKAGRGDLASAARHLDEGASAAASLGLPRLRARVENERVRLGLPASPQPAAGGGKATREPDFGFAEIVAQLDDATEIRKQLAVDPDVACRRAEEWVRRVERESRPRAAMQASRLLVACLVAAGRVDEAEPVLASIAATCARIGFVRYLIDGGPRMVPALTALLEDRRAGRWQSDWPEVPEEFLVAALETATPIES
ncbi:serine/threonine-protein kinase [Rhodococcus wratislaviensis]|uniref:serine/threonine-protein kinase n=1 Tax=Rhodococcus wratislaviensis TaxID=44752 RepID=UPI000DD3FD91|nr:serine/threonine-protein kinase [Rhodococcus wratislaviensis]